MKVLICKHCHKVVLVLNDVGPTPICCGEKMVELNANTTDAALEKHVPSVTVNGNNVHVQVGDVIHPMLPEHYIEFIALETTKGVSVHYLKPGDTPTTDFTLSENETAIAVYELCNLHGLWKKEL